VCHTFTGQLFKVYKGYSVIRSVRSIVVDVLNGTNKPFCIITGTKPITFGNLIPGVYVCVYVSVCVCVWSYVTFVGQSKSHTTFCKYIFLWVCKYTFTACIECHTVGADMC
jgi:hypothetical protein